MADRGKDFDTLKVGAGSVEDVIKVAPDPSVLDPKKTQGREHRQLLYDIIDTVAGAFQRLNASSIRGLDQKVRNLTRRDLLAQRILVVGMRCYVASNSAALAPLAEPAEYVLIQDSAGPLTAFLEADTDSTDTTKARWVRYTGTAAQIAQSYPLFQEFDKQYKLGDTVRYEFAIGDVRLTQALADMPSSGNQNPRPTGADSDTNWFTFQPLSGGGVTLQMLLDGLATREPTFKPLQGSEVVLGSKGIVGLALRPAIIWLANRGAASSLPQPEAPTLPILDDTANTFSGVAVPGYSSFLEYEGNWGDGGWVPLTNENAYQVDNRPTMKGLTGFRAAGTVALRVAASGGREAGKALVSQKDFTGPAEPTGFPYNFPFKLK